MFIKKPTPNKGTSSSAPPSTGSSARNYLDTTLQQNGASSKSSLTADTFQEIWKHYDKNGNNVLERREIDQFLEDVVASEKLGVGHNAVKLSEEQAHQRKIALLVKFDRNRDGDISIGELAHELLPASESFILLFRLDNETGTGHDYMKIWKKYDEDLSGFIELNELKLFLRDLIASANKGAAPDQQRLNLYATQIMSIYDVDHDGKLSLSELSRMLPAKQNFVKIALDKALALDKLFKDDIVKLLDHYDTDRNGTLEGAELTNLVRDILAMAQKDGFYNATDVYDLEQALLMGCDLDKDGHIDLKELAVIILAMAQSERSEKAMAAHRDAKDLGPGHGNHPASETGAAFGMRVFQGRKGQHILSYVSSDSE